MPDFLFDQIIRTMQDIHIEHPDLAIGEVLQIAADKKKKTHNADLHNMSSKEMLKALEDLKNEFSNEKIKEKEKSIAKNRRE